MPNFMHGINSVLINGENKKFPLCSNKKGFHRTLFPLALKELDKENYEQTCLQLFRQKQHKLKAEKEVSAMARLIRFGLARGFDYDTVRHCLNLLKEENQTDSPEDIKDDVSDA